MNIHRHLSRNFSDLKVFYKVFHKLWKSMLITLFSAFYVKEQHALCDVDYSP